SNIKFNYAENCFAKGIQSDYCNFAHIEINYSYKVQVSESYFRLAHDYGRGGKGYGIALQFASSDCLIENNIFSTLRHAVLFQAGANGNVVAYNYSIKPFWNEPNFPENAAGDIVLHGNYPFGNLIEGNIAQNIVVDDSHGKNGPANLFMNNTAELYGFFINPNAADSQIIIDNKITNKAFLKGNYYVFGEGHYEYGNKVKSKYVPSNTTESEYGSFYRSKYSCKLSSEYRIKAEMRYKEGIYTECWEDTRISDDATFNEGYVGIDNHQNSELSLYPNPAQHSITIETVQPVLITVYNLSGAQILTTNQKVIDVSNWQKGTYLFIIKEKETQITTNKRVLVN
ncbi:MAG: T9SS type A sorting domain-containing protein, partial [Bacteroidia bacterium]